MHPLAPRTCFAGIDPLPLPDDNQTLMLWGAGAAALAVALFVVVRWLRRKKPVDPEEGLAEDLASIGPPERGRRHYRLLVYGQPVRLRLAVVAPVGKNPLGKVDSVLEQVLRGLGEAALDDKPRLRAWPPQLSVAGFAPTFFRRTRRPDPPGGPSRWILLAGPARAGGARVLVGLAVYADAPSTTGLLTLGETQWADVLRVENA
jgi:hypothetical protein